MRYGDDWLLQLLIAGCQWPLLMTRRCFVDSGLLILVY